MIRNNSKQRRPGTINTPNKTRIRKQPQFNKENQYSQYQDRWFSNGNTANSKDFSIFQGYQINSKNINFYDNVEVNLSGRGIEHIERHMDRSIQLQYVVVLNLSFNSIQNFPQNIFSKLTSMTQLDLQSNCLGKLSFPYFSQNMLKKVNISMNNLVSVNMDHLQIMTDLNCSKNKLTFLTLPSSLRKINCGSNKLSNIYFLENCYLLEDIIICQNLLYDLKFSFKSVGGGRNENVDKNQGEFRYKNLRYLDCSCNKIQYFEGMINAVNLNILKIHSNCICFTRDLIDQLLILQNLESIEVDGTSSDPGSLAQQELLSIFAEKLPKLRELNGYNPDMFIGRYEFKEEKEIGGQFSGIKDEPYELFIEPEEKMMKFDGKNTMEWNFTLGDQKNNNNNSSLDEVKINELSYIQELQPLDKMENTEHFISYQPEDVSPIDQDTSYVGLGETAVDRNMVIGDREGSVSGVTCKISAISGKRGSDEQLQDMLGGNSKEMRMKVVKSASPLAVPHHIHYQPFLKALLPMSYIPAYPILKKAPKATSRRLQQDDDDYLLISKMFESRGGVVYIKKLTNWLLDENGEEVFGRYGTKYQPHMGFLLNEMGEKEFRELCRYSKPIGQNVRDILGMQPNVFSCFHVLVRVNPYCKDTCYHAAYLIESSHSM